MVDDYGVVYLAPIDWTFRKQDHQFTCLALAARGKPVVYVENTGARFPSWRDLGRVLGRLRNAARSLRPSVGLAPKGIAVVSPLVIPGGEHGLERFINRALLRNQVAPTLSAMRGRKLVMWVGLPTWASLDLIDAVQPDLVVYYCGDAFREVPGVRPGLAVSEARLLQRADVVFANSSALAEYCRAQGADPQFIPIGIDLSVSARYRAAHVELPSELRDLRGRLIGYMGGLNHKVDVGMLDAVVDAFPEDSVVVLGGVEDPRFRPSSPRVLILGERPYDEIGRYLMHFDVCLIPYVVNPFTESVYPGKLVEYLAHGRPVVSTPIREVLPYAAVVKIESTVDGFVAAVAQTLAEPDSADRRAERVRAIEQNAYENVVDAMISAVEARVAWLA